MKDLRFYISILFLLGTFSSFGVPKSQKYVQFIKISHAKVRIERKLPAFHFCERRTPKAWRFLLTIPKSQNYEHSNKRVSTLYAQSLRANNTYQSFPYSAEHGTLSKRERRNFNTRAKSSHYFTSVFTRTRREKLIFKLHIMNYLTDFKGLGGSTMQNSSTNPMIYKDDNFTIKVIAEPDVIIEISDNNENQLSIFRIKKEENWIDDFFINHEINLIAILGNKTLEKEAITNESLLVDHRRSPYKSVRNVRNALIYLNRNFYIEVGNQPLHYEEAVSIEVMDSSLRSLTIMKFSKEDSKYTLSGCVTYVNDSLDQLELANEIIIKN